MLPSQRMWSSTFRTRSDVRLSVYDARQMLKCNSWVCTFAYRKFKFKSNEEFCSNLPTSFASSVRCPNIRNVGCCTIMPALPGTQSSYNWQDVPLVSTAGDQASPSGEGDSIADSKFPVQVPSIQPPTGVQVASLEMQAPPESQYPTPLDQFSYVPNTQGISLEWCLNPGEVEWCDWSRLSEAVTAENPNLTEKRSNEALVPSKSLRLASPRYGEHFLAVQSGKLSQRKWFTAL